MRQPAAGGREPAILSDASPCAPLGGTATPAKILLVDDEPSILASTRLLLEDMGYAVVTSGEAGRILEILRKERPDLLLQDVRMPGLDLHATLRALRADPELGRTPVLLFSASLSLSSIVQEVQAQGLLEKPFRPAELKNAIERAIAQHGG